MFDPTNNRCKILFNARILRAVLKHHKVSSPSAFRTLTGVSWTTAKKVMKGLPVTRLTAKKIADEVGYTVDYLCGITKSAESYSSIAHNVAGNITWRCLSGEFQTDDPVGRVSCNPKTSERAHSADNVRDVIANLAESSDYAILNADLSITEEVIALLSQEKVICQGSDRIWRFTPNLKNLLKNRCKSWRRLNGEMIDGLYEEANGVRMNSASLSRVMLALARLESLARSDSNAEIIAFVFAVHRSIALCNPDFSEIYERFLSGAQALLEAELSRLSDDEADQLVIDISETTISFADNLINPEELEASSAKESNTNFIDLIEGLIRG